jgi:hypothetical protein
VTGTIYEYLLLYTGYTQKNGAVLIVNTIISAPFFCVCSVYLMTMSRMLYIGVIICALYG